MSFTLYHMKATVTALSCGRIFFRSIRISSQLTAVQNHLIEIIVVKCLIPLTHNATRVGVNQDRAFVVTVKNSALRLSAFNFRLLLVLTETTFLNNMFTYNSCRIFQLTMVVE